MNPLPQRKKTAEEIAALRDGFMPHAPAPAAVTHSAPPEPVAQTFLSEPPEPRPPSEPKPVRSLRKSERGPSLRRTQSPTINPQSNLPAHRHSDQELNYLRRAQAVEIQSPAAHLLVLTAHPFIVAAGYVFVITAALLPIIDYLWADVSRYIPAGLCLAGLAISAFIFLKKKRSLHHAGFIAAIAILTLIFGSLYYLPLLRNAP